MNVTGTTMKSLARGRGGSRLGGEGLHMEQGWR